MKTTECKLSNVLFMTAALSLMTVATLQAAAPKVISTVPENQSEDVDPKLREIRIEFDQDMNPRGYSVCGGGPAFPKIIGKPRWRGKRKFVMRVKLEPNHQYTFSINCPSATKFKNRRGESVMPYTVTFHTAAAETSGILPEDNESAIDELKRALADNYSYIELRGVDWDKAFGRHVDKLKTSTSPKAFAREAGKLLANAKDVHIWLKAEDKIIGSYRRKAVSNYNYATLSKVVPGFKRKSKAVCVGRFLDGTGYIFISSWSSESADALEAAFDALAEFQKGPGLIVDVRANSGGSEPLAQAFAGCFIEEPVVYAQHVTRAKDLPGGFTPAMDRKLEPRSDRPKYRGKVAVLMGPANMSSCEAFLLMMKQVANCKLIGDTSYGSSGNPKPYLLSNDVTVFLPSWKAMRPDGSCFEGEGIAPDMVIKTDRQILLRRDPILKAARKYLAGPS